MISLTFHNTTHASLFKRYRSPDDGFVEVGESGRHGPIDPETGAEYRAFGGADHRYNRDYEVGSSYPKCGFFTAVDGDESLSHDELEAFLKGYNLWMDDLEPAIIPRGMRGGEWTWYYGFQFTPVERTPRMKRMTEKLERKVGDDDMVFASATTIEVALERPDTMEEITA